jgi:hypothetical protein
VAVGLARVPALAGFAGVEELSGNSGDRCHQRLLTGAS